MNFTKLLLAIALFISRNGGCMERCSDFVSERNLEHYNRTVPWTPLHEACATGDSDYVTEYIAKYVKADGQVVQHCKINKLGRYDRDMVATPLFLASNYGHTDIVALLLQTGTDVGIETHDDYHTIGTPLHAAYNKEIAQLLIQHGADINAPSVRQETPLITHTIKQNYDIVQLLIQAGADVEHRDQYKKNALAYALAYEDDEKSQSQLLSFIIELLYEAARECFKVNRWKSICERAQQKNENPLSLLCREGGQDSICRYTDEEHILYAFYHKNAHVNLQDAETLMTPLHWACTRRREGYTKPLSMLLNVPGINVNVQNDVGHTPLHVACIFTSNLSDNRVDILLATGKVDFSLRDKQGKNIIQHACDCYTKWWETCEDDAEGWPVKDRESIIAHREVAMHKIICAAAKPMQCALIQYLFVQKHIKKDARVALLPEIIGLIMRFFYELNSELVVARTYKPESIKADCEHVYYTQMHDVRKQIKEKMLQSPTKEDIRLLWEQ